jgi:outer membrane protein insertion porin family
MGLLVTSSAAREKSVQFWGNQRLSDDRLKALVPANWDVSSEQDLLARVQQAYIEVGFLFATIDVERGLVDGNLVLVIDEGQPARFGRVRIAGAKAFGEDKVIKILGAQRGAHFKPDVLQRGIETLLEEYDTQGFPFAQVWMDSLQLDPSAHSVHLTVFVVEGESKQLDRIEVEGLQSTREDLAIRLSGLKEGEPYDGEKIRDAHLRLKSSGIFDDVAYPTIRLSTEGQGVDALIRVIEPSKNNTFSFAVGYAETEGRDGNVLNGVVRLDLVNIGGSLRDLNIFWSNDGAGRSDTRFAFRQRFIRGRPLSFGLSLEQIGLDTLYTWQSIGVETAAPVGRLLGGLFGLDFAVHGDRNTFSVDDVSKSLRLRLIGGFSFVKGKERRGGFFELRNRNTYARKSIERRDGNPDESLTQIIVEARARLAAGIFTNLHFANETTLRNLSSDEALIPLSEQFYVGGAATLRGYRENQFHGRQVAYSRSELLIGRSRMENGYIFVDVGYILDEALLPSGGIATNDLYKLGYGFGVRTQSNAGNIDISFGVGEELSLEQTKIHVILDRSF